MAQSPHESQHEQAVELEAAHASAANVRFCVRLADGARVESVLYRGSTLCVSSQVGCAVGCGFCASGAKGFARNLSLSEMLGQLDAVLARGHRIERVTLSGVGEPLHNWDAALAFMEHCRSRRIWPSLTTSGGPITRLAQALCVLHNGLTLSVHAGTEATRAALVPHAPTLAALFDCVAGTLPSLTRRRRRKTALAYLLLAGDNDHDHEIDAFIERARPLGLCVHLFAYNEVSSSGHRRVNRARYEAVYSRMTASGLRVRMSSRARIEGNGGCGTLLALRPERSIVRVQAQ